MSEHRSSAPTGIEFRVDKAARRLHVFVDGVATASHTIRLGKNTTSDKAVEGDCATPVGDFYICAKNPRSKYFLSLCLSYPGIDDAARGLASGLITPEESRQIIDAIGSRKMPPQHTRLGGEIYIHGEAPAGSERNWTRGCIALNNAIMQQVYDLADIGTPVRIV